MPTIIKKPSILSDRTVYYTGDQRWSDDKSDAKLYLNDSKANAAMLNTDGTNGGWTGATTETV